MAQYYHDQRRSSSYREDGVVVREQEAPPANVPILSDEHWAEVELHLPSATSRGRPLEHERRALVTAYSYLVRIGCGWRQLPAVFPPWQTAHWHVTHWRRAGLLPLLYAILMRE